MSKELTEQWRNGTLKEGYYYIENKSKSIKFVEIDYYNVFGDTRYWSGCDDEDIEEVLAPVPSYEQDKLKDDIINDLLWKLELSVQTEVNLTKKIKELENAIESQADYFRQQISVLESRIKEANEVIKFYANAEQLTEEEKQMTAEKYHLVYGLKANDYLEKWGVE